YSRRTVIGKKSEVIRARSGGDGKDVIQIEAGRINGNNVIVVVRIARRCDENDAGLAQAIDGVTQRLGVKARAAPTGVHDLRTLTAREVDALDGVRSEPVPSGVQKFAGHDLNLPADADNADGVVAHRADRSADMRAVAMIIVGVAGVVYGVDAVNVVHVPVAVVVNAITRNLPRIDPHVVGQVFVCIAHAGVNDRHDDVGRGVLTVARGLRADIRAWRAAVNAGVVQAPKRSITITEVIGRLQGLHLIIRFRV